MEKCLRNVEAGMAKKETLAYADDVAMIRDSASALKEAADRCQNEMTLKEMKIGTRETEVMGAR